MDKLSELREKRGKLEAEVNALLSASKNAKRDLTPDESARVDEIFEEDKIVKADIAREEANIQRIEKAAAMSQELSQSSGRRTRDPEPKAARVEVRDLILDDPKCGFKGVGEFMKVVKSASKGGTPDARLLKISAAAYGLNESSGEDGGFPVPPEFSNRIFERATGAGLGILSKCDRITTTSNMITLNATVDHDRSSTTYRYGGVIPYWTSEADQLTRSNLKFRQITLKLNKIACLSYVTDEELEDASVGVVERTYGKMGEAMSGEIENCLMFGDGVGKPKGLFVSNCVVSAAKDTDQEAATIVAENIIQMQKHSWSGAGGAEWYYNPTCFPQLVTMYVAVGTGGYPVFLPSNNIANAPYSTIFGRPARATEHCAALGTAGDIVLGDFSQYLVAIKGTVNTAVSMHLRFDYMEVAYRASMRIDGQPAWEQPLTIRNGSLKVSPAVQLTTRS